MQLLYAQLIRCTGILYAIIRAIKSGIIIRNHPLVKGDCFKEHGFTKIAVESPNLIISAAKPATLALHSPGDTGTVFAWCSAGEIAKKFKKLGVLCVLCGSEFLSDIDWVKPCFRENHRLREYLN